MIHEGPTQTGAAAWLPKYFFHNDSCFPIYLKAACPGKYLANMCEHLKWYAKTARFGLIDVLEQCLHGKPLLQIVPATSIAESSLAVTLM